MKNNQAINMNIKLNEQTIATPGRITTHRLKAKKKKSGLFSMLPFNFGRGKKVISVLRLEGVIGKVSSFKSGLTMSSLNQQIEKAFAFDRLEAVCLIINSPGGSPVQSDLIANRIMQLSQEKNIPVYSFVEDVAASGGYWLACAGDKIYANLSSVIGSIGVVSSGFGFQNAMEKLGVERRIFTEGKSKSVLDPFRPVQANDITILQKIQKNIHAHFIDAVKKQRAGKLTQDDEVLFNGEFWPGQIAADYGLIDGIDDFYSFINRKYGDNIEIEYITPKTSWLKRKLGMVNTPTAPAADLTENLVKAAIDLAENSKFFLK